jgi:hypothetical protein
MHKERNISNNNGIIRTAIKRAKLRGTMDQDKEIHL